MTAKALLVRHKYAKLEIHTYVGPSCTLSIVHDQESSFLFQHDQPINFAYHSLFKVGLVLHDVILNNQTCLRVDLD